MPLQIRATPKNVWATKLSKNLKKYFSITEEDEVVMVAKADFNPEFIVDPYGAFVPQSFVYETDNEEEPTYFRELRWKATPNSIAPLTGAISTPIFVVQLINPPEDEGI